MVDARTVGLTDLVEVIDNGSDAPGTLLDDCSPAFRRPLRRGRPHHRQGPGQLRVAQRRARPIYFLFKVKCSVVADQWASPRARTWSRVEPLSTSHASRDRSDVDAAWEYARVLVDRGDVSVLSHQQAPPGVARVITPCATSGCRLELVTASNRDGNESCTSSVRWALTGRRGPGHSAEQVCLASPRRAPPVRALVPQNDHPPSPYALTGPRDQREMGPVRRHLDLLYPWLRPDFAARRSRPGLHRADAGPGPAIPIVLSGRDLLAGAQTGTGKTAAFVLPMLDGLHARRESGHRKVRALVVVPTRELALQVEQSVRTYGGRSPIRSVAIYGGVRMDRQVRSLRKWPEIDRGHAGSPARPRAPGDRST